MCYGQHVVIPECACERCTARRGCERWEPMVTEREVYWIDDSGQVVVDTVRVYPHTVCCDTCSQDGTGWVACALCLYAAGGIPKLAAGIMVTLINTDMATMIAAGWRPSHMLR